MTDKDGKTPLHIAILNKDVAKLLIDLGADVDMATESGFTPLLMAARRGYQRCRGWKGYLQVAQLLFEHGADMDKPNRKCSNGKTAREYLSLSDQRSEITDISEVE